MTPTIASAIPEISLGAPHDPDHALLRVICHLYTGTFDIVYECTKFDHHSFSHSKNMINAHQNLNGSRDLTTSISGLISRPGIALTKINLPIKCLQPQQRNIILTTNQKPQ